MHCESVSKGDRFEADVAKLLRTLQRRHPTNVQVRSHPTITLVTGETLIPDFELTTRQPYATVNYLLECQDRKRTQKEILHKIKYMKSLSERNLIMFVYRESIPEATATALKLDGVTHLSFASLSTFVVRVDKQFTFDIGHVSKMMEATKCSLQRAHERLEASLEHDYQEFPYDNAEYPPMLFNTSIFRI